MKYTLTKMKYTKNSEHPDSDMDSENYRRRIKIPADKKIVEYLSVNKKTCVKLCGEVVLIRTEKVKHDTENCFELYIDSVEILPEEKKYTDKEYKEKMHHDMKKGFDRVEKN